jgi:hypothetical protein
VTKKTNPPAFGHPLSQEGLIGILTKQGRSSAMSNVGPFPNSNIDNRSNHASSKQVNIFGSCNLFELDYILK